MVEERFDAVVVGAGPAGAIAAYIMASNGMKVALIERGEYPGAKNVFGGVLYRTPLDTIFPEFWKEAPLERCIVEQRMWVLGQESAAKFAYRDPRFAADSPNCWTGIRANFDQWLAGKAEKAGALPIYETVVTGLIQHDNKVVGVHTDREDGDIYADVVIIADGVNSLLAKSLGIHREWKPDEVSLAVKEVISLPKGTIQDRFNLEENEGATTEFIGNTFGMAGLGFLYTNESSVSLGVGIMVSDLQKNRIKPYKVLDQVKQHPEIRRLIAGGEVKEYAAHLIPEAGLNAMPPLAGDGWMVCGDAAQMVNMVHREGTNLAMTSGQLAGNAAVFAYRHGDYSLNTLQTYTEWIRGSIVYKDLKKYRGLHGLLRDENPEMLFGALPRTLNDALFNFLSVDGGTKKDKQHSAISSLRAAAGGNVKLARLMLRGWRAMNG
jgi:electron transfer flavoprotein-quinone oxidoreductase